MTERALPRLAARPSDVTSLAEVPPAGATFLMMSTIPASGSCGRSTGIVECTPTTNTRRFWSRTEMSAYRRMIVDSRRSALETTDALSRNKVGLDSNRMLFFVDRLFHRRGLGGFCLLIIERPLPNVERSRRGRHPFCQAHRGLRNAAHSGPYCSGRRHVENHTLRLPPCSVDRRQFR